ncbi:MAG TPA: ABC transporter ATP-binding protein, partial [Chitinophagaceae bacterium]|nr:ABC transporter ATP-binding protein [Chitinophagaceae bacterium]
MRTLIHYLKPYKWLVALVLTLAAINIGFSLVDPIIFGRLVDLASYHQTTQNFSWNDFLYTRQTVSISLGDKVVEQKLYGIVWLLLASISVAMVSRIAKAFQDYFLN